jgi:site-specific DNA-methyltransferase (adenine-specific)
MEGLKQLPDETVDCVVTSPPYWNLRDYGIEGQMGLEPTIEEYVNKLCDVFDEIKRTLKKTGTCWVNLGDSYGNGKGMQKSLCQIPSRFAIEMSNRGWILRNTIIWFKPNCMPSSVKDRFTVDYEFVYFFTKNKRYYFEQQLEDALTPGSVHVGKKGDKGSMIKETVNATYFDRNYVTGNKRNKRCVWKIPPQGFPGAHFAVFPEKLVETPIRGGCPPGGVVLDPFIGSGTTAVVAKKLERDFLGIDISAKYCEMARERIAKVPERLNKVVGK